MAMPEQHLLISDLRLDGAAQISPNTLNTLADWADGREGQFVLVNGQLLRSWRAPWMVSPRPLPGWREKAP